MTVVTNVVGLLPISLQNTLQQIVERVNALQGGIRVILISTAEGVPLGRVYSSSSVSSSDNTNHPYLSRSHNNNYNNNNDPVMMSQQQQQLPFATQQQQQQQHQQQQPQQHAAVVERMQEDVLSSIESTWAPASKQFPLLNMGKEMKTVTAIYDHGTVIHVYNLAPIVVTICTNPHCNLGSIYSTCIPLLKQVLQPLCTTLLDSLGVGSQGQGGQGQQTQQGGKSQQQSNQPADAANYFNYPHHTTDGGNYYQ